MNESPLPLFMVTAPHNGTQTSKDAAASIKPRVHTLRAKVLAYAASRGALGFTTEEACLDLGMSGDTCRPRVCELRETDCIEDSGTTRKTLSGRNAVVWRFRP